jgi:hypothetical protein
MIVKKKNETNHFVKIWDSKNSCFPSSLIELFIKRRIWNMKKKNKDYSNDKEKKIEWKREDLIR